MPAYPLPPSLARHTPQLWGTVAELCRAGFAVDPYEARVLFADFGLEAWHAPAAQEGKPGGVLPAASFERALAQRFYEYAAANLVPLSAARWRLRDMYATLQRLTPDDHAGSWRELTEALARMPEDDVERLRAFRAHGLPCEWRLAFAEGSTIRHARTSLAQAAVRWLELAAKLDPHGEQPVIACALWSQGRNVASVARLLRLPVARVEAVRATLGSELARALDAAPPPRRNRGRTTLQNNEFSTLLTLLSRGDHHKAAHLLLLHGAQLLEQLDDDDLQLHAEAATIAANRPETLAEAYRLLLGMRDDTQEFVTNAARQAQALQQRAADHVASAFHALVDDLPAELVDWPRLLPRDAVGRFDTSVPDAAPSRQAAVLRRYGLAPESFVGIARSVQLQCDALRHRNTVPAFFTADDAPEPPEPGDERVSLDLGQLRACVRVAPHVPGHAGLVDALARWTLDVVAERPHFVPGYESDLSDTARDTLLAVPRRSARADGVQDLRALWITRRTGGSEHAAAW